MKPTAKPTSSPQTLLREIEAYRSHCLFAEAFKRADELKAVIRRSGRFKEKDRHLAAVDRKVREIEKEAEAFEAIGRSVRLSSRDRKKIKDVFASSRSKGSDAAIHEAAIAMLVFGQYEDALDEFGRLVGSERFRVSAAKNIIRCHVALSSLDEAVGRYHRWLEEGALPAAELESVRHFLRGILRKKGAADTLKQPSAPSGGPAPGTEPPVRQDGPPDLLSAAIAYRDRSDAEKEALLDVQFQRGTTVNVIIPGKYEDLIAFLQPGRKLEGVQLNSADMISIESCIVRGKNLIRVGGNRGDYTVTLQIQ